jgi:hypothetical protein
MWRSPGAELCMRCMPLHGPLCSELHVLVWHACGELHAVLRLEWISHR